jgi:hypothetical protein
MARNFEETAMLNSTERREKRFLIYAAALVAVLGIAMPKVLAADSQNPDLRYAGTVDIDQTRVSFIVSGNGGGGTLHYAGRDYPFSIGGIGIGGIGITKLIATGQVYNMNHASKFPGVYSELRTGYAIGDKGHGKLWLKNGDGVILKLQGKGKGIGLSLGADAVNVAFAKHG